MTPVETGEPHGSADQGSALGGSQEGGGNASAQRREEGRPGCEAIGRARCWKCWRGRQVGGTSPQGGWQSRHGAFEVTSAPARRSHRTGATHRGVPPRLTDLPLRHLSPPPFKTSLASNSKRARTRTASSPTHRIPWITVGTSSSPAVDEHRASRHRLGGLALRHGKAGVSRARARTIAPRPKRLRSRTPLGRLLSRRRRARVAARASGSWPLHALVRPPNGDPSCARVSSRVRRLI
jgi:hypothetical protein